MQSDLTMLHSTGRKYKVVIGTSTDSNHGTYTTPIFDGDNLAYSEKALHTLSDVLNHAQKSQPNGDTDQRKNFSPALNEVVEESVSNRQGLPTKKANHQPQNQTLSRQGNNVKRRYTRSQAGSKINATVERTIRFHQRSNLSQQLSEQNKNSKTSPHNVRLRHPVMRKVRTKVAPTVIDMVEGLSHVPQSEMVPQRKGQSLQIPSYLERTLMRAQMVTSMTSTRNMTEPYLIKQPSERRSGNRIKNIPTINRVQNSETARDKDLMRRPVLTKRSVRLKDSIPRTF